MVNFDRLHGWKSPAVPVRLPARRPVAPSVTPPRLSLITGSRAQRTFEEVIYNELLAGRASRWLTFNLSGLKFVNDHYLGGHKTGDAYRAAVVQKLKGVASRQFNIRLERVEVFINGPNLAIHIPEGANTAKLFEAVRREFQSGVRFTAQVKDKATKKELAKDFEYTMMSEGRSEIFNQGEIIFDKSLLSKQGKVLISKEGIYRALREEIYYLNRREITSNRHDKSYLIGADQAALLNSYCTQVRLIDARARVEAASGPNVEPNSRLYNVDQLEADAARILGEGRTAHFSFFDGNAISAFRSLGFAGEIMMDAIVEELMAQAAVVLPNGITLYRHGSGSEEFYLLGDSGKVAAEQMRAASKDFMAALNKLPFRVLIEVDSLQQTEAGRRYLLEHTEQKIRTLEMQNGRSVKVIPVDITKCIRENAVTKKLHRGVTITLGQGSITPQMVLRLTARGTKPENAPAVAFEQAFKAIMELGEAVKALNSERYHLFLEVDFVDGEAVGRVLPLDLKRADPMPIPDYFRSGLLHDAYLNGWTIEVSPAVTPFFMPKIV